MTRRDTGRKPAEPADLDVRQLVDDWDAMSASYLPGRMQLVEAAVAAIQRQLAGRPGTVVELGSGPGTLVRALASAVPNARIVGIDADPVLAAIHRAEAARTGLGPMEVVDADLAAPGWDASVAGPVHAVVAVQVLHYFVPERFVLLLSEFCELLAPGGVFVHLDVLPGGDTRHGHEAGVRDGDPWADWWASARREPALASAFRDRDRAFANRAPSAEFHPDQREFHAALAAAGFDDIQVIDRVGQVALTTARRP